MKNELNHLVSSRKLLDIEVFCQVNLYGFQEAVRRKSINIKFAKGAQDVLEGLLEKFFGGLELENKLMVNK